jgi:hypothetical protein
MPDTALSQEDIDFLKAKGIDPSSISILPDEDISKAATVGRTLKAHAGGIGGGGIGTLLGTAAAPTIAASIGLAPETMGASLLVPLALGTAGALIGGYTGQKVQENIQSPETTAAQQEALQQAQEQHPLVSAGTDIAAGALASGGSFSPSTTLKGIRGLISRTPEDLAALRNVALQSTINPAISAGTQYATTGTIPTTTELASQAVGGALFAKPSWLGKMSMRPGVEPNAKDTTPITDTQQPTAEVAEVLSPYTAKNDAGEPLISDAIVKKAYLDKNAITKEQMAGMTETDKYIAMTKNNNMRKFMRTADMRKALHDEFLKNMGNQSEGEVAESVQSKEPYTPQFGEMPNQSNLAEFQEYKDENITNPQRAEDFRKAQEELALQEQHPGDVASAAPKENEETVTPKNPIKPIAPNTLRVLNPSTLLQSNITRPEVRPEQKNLGPIHQAPERQSDYDQYTELWKKLGPMMEQGDVENPEFLKMWKESEAIKNRNEGKVPTKQSAVQPNFIPKPEYAPEAVSAHIISDKATTGSVMAKIASSEAPEAPLAKALYEHMDEKSRNVPWKTFLIKRSEYAQLEDKVKMGIIDTHHTPTIMEEAIHSMTSAKLPIEWEGLRGHELLTAMTDYLKTGSNESIKELIRSYIQTAQHMGVHDRLFMNEKGLAGDADVVQKGLGAGHDISYAMGNLHEFIAHAFKNAKFQHLLNEMPSGKPGQTMWQKIVDAVRHLLGFDVKQGSMLDRVLRNSAELISQQREGAKNAIQEQSTSRVLQHAQGENAANGGERGGVEQGKQGKEITRQSPAKEQETLKEPYFKPTESLVGKVRRIGHAGASKLSDALKLTMNDKDALLGKYKNSTIDAGKNLSHGDMAQINRVMDAERTTGQLHPEMLQNAAQKEFYKTARKNIDESGKEAISRKIPIMQNGVPRLMKQQEGHWPMMANQKVEQIYRENTDRASMAALDKRFDEWNQKTLGMSPEESKSRIENWKAAIQGTPRGSDVSHQDYFNALRKAQGDPLPPEFREANPVKNLSRYFDRYATAASHYSNIESNPEVMRTLGATKMPWGESLEPHPEGSLANNPTVRGALESFVKESSGPAEKNEASISAIATSMFIAGPPLEVHKVVSNTVKAESFADNPYQAFRATAYALTHVKEGYIHAKEGGVVKMTASSVGDMFSGTATAAERLQGLSKAIRDVSTLGDLTTRFNAGFQQSFFEFLVPSKLARANAGDKEAQAFIKNLDPSYSRGKQYDDVGQRQLASIAAKYVHGTGDIRSMPGWMLNDGEVSGFFKLAHWSVAQTNNFMHDVYAPATRGNYTPLIMSVFGSLAGGYMIKELRQMLQGKKNQIPSLQEIAASDRGLQGNAGLLGYNAIAAMMYSGFGGLLSQIAKYPFDFVYKNVPQGATFPLDEVAGDLLDTFRNVSTAIANDPHLNWVDLAQTVTHHILTSNIQLTRMAINQGINAGVITGLPAEKKMLSDKIAQLRRFDMVEGLPYNQQDEGSNPYMNIEQRKFKMEQDPAKAIEMLPKLLGTIVKTYGNNPDVMLQKMKALKENQYATMPSMETMPLSMMKYIGYLTRMEGEQSAQAALQDYMSHRVINEAKSSVVP